MKQSTEIVNLERSYSPENNATFTLEDMTMVLLEFSEGGPDNTIDIEPYRSFVVPRIALHKIDSLAFIPIFYAQLQEFHI